MPKRIITYILTNVSTGEQDTAVLPASTPIGEIQQIAREGWKAQRKPKK